MKIRILDIFLADDTPTMGSAELDGKHVVWKERDPGKSYNYWVLNDEEWARVNSQPRNEVEEAELAAIYYGHGMDSGNSAPLFQHHEADWSEVF